MVGAPARRLPTALLLTFASALAAAPAYGSLTVVPGNRQRCLVGVDTTSTGASCGSPVTKVRR